MRLADFIIIGAMKCATSTLHEQLARQPGLFMSTPKEPNFFSDDEQWGRGLQWYGSLFAAVPDDAMCGESSTHYTKLPTYPDTIRRMQETFQRPVKLIYIMRDPIERLVSQYIHEWSQRIISEPIDDAIRAHPELVQYSRYASQIAPYLNTFGSEAVLPVFFERLLASPQVELARVCRFIGYRERPCWFAEDAQKNASNQRRRSNSVRDAILDAPMLAALRRRLVRRSWRDRIRRLWVTQDRPTISLPQCRRLRAIFDEDLVQLGDWLGLELSCDNFASIAEQTSPQWRNRRNIVTEKVA
ncbi:MAG: sulfotransferase domain-containing protein [Phycisphaerales bacterium]